MYVSFQEYPKTIEDKKNKGTKQDLLGNTSSNWNIGSSKEFKNTKNSGSLNK